MKRQEKSQKLISLEEASQKLGVSTKTLLKLNENDILKAKITPEGKIGYSKKQIKKFLQVRNETKKKADETKIQNELFNSFLSRVGGKFYKDEYIKTYLKTQVDESITIKSSPLPKRTLSLVTILFFILFVSFFTQQNRIKSYVESFQKRQQLDLENAGKVLAAESRLKLSGHVIFQTPLIGKEDSNFEKNLYVQ